MKITFLMFLTYFIIFEHTKVALEVVILRKADLDGIYIIVTLIMFDWNIENRLGNSIQNMLNIWKYEFSPVFFLFVPCLAYKRRLKNLILIWYSVVSQGIFDWNIVNRLGNYVYNLLNVWKCYFFHDFYLFLTYLSFRWHIIVNPAMFDWNI